MGKVKDIIKKAKGVAASDIMKSNGKIQGKTRILMEDMDQIRKKEKGKTAVDYAEEIAEAEGESISDVAEREAKKGNKAAAEILKRQKSR